MATGRTSTWHGVAADEGLTVSTFDELQDAIAWLGYHNPRYDLFLRGQSSDFRNAGSKLHESLLAPSILRPSSGKKGISPKVLSDRMAALAHYARYIATIRKRDGIRALKRHPVAVWALLQHYGVARTPLLDVTRSVRVAATFAVPGKDDVDGYVFAFGLPHPTGNITFDYANETVLLNLRNLMPPDAKRPHYQEGYLIGSLSECEMTIRERNVAKRLLGKFRIPKDRKATFFMADNPGLPNEILFPENDPVLSWCASFPASDFTVPARAAPPPPPA